MARSDDELSERHYRKVLHEPLAPYVVNTYNTLTHLVQSLVLAAIFYVLTTLPPITLLSL